MKMMINTPQYEAINQQNRRFSHLLILHFNFDLFLFIFECNKKTIYAFWLKHAKTFTGIK